MIRIYIVFFFSSRRRHTRLTCDWSSDVCSSDLEERADRSPPPHTSIRRLLLRGREALLHGLEPLAHFLEQVLEFLEPLLGGELLAGGLGGFFAGISGTGICTRLSFHGFLQP